MKFAPHLMVGFTVSAALAAGALLAAEDRALFEPQHAVAMLDVVDEVGAAWAPALAKPQGQRSTPAGQERALGAPGRP
jgi:hypothetical protein